MTAFNSTACDRKIEAFLLLPAHCVFMNTGFRADVCCLKLIVTAAHRLQWRWKTEPRIKDYFLPSRLKIDIKEIKSSSDI